MEGMAGRPLKREHGGHWIDTLVAAVTGRGLEAPALLVLEAARPFHFLIQQALYVAHPLCRPWLGERLALWADLIEDGEALERVAEVLRRQI